MARPAEVDFGLVQAFAASANLTAVSFVEDAGKLRAEVGSESPAALH
jgi:hypothetical protein